MEVRTATRVTALGPAHVELVHDGIAEQPRRTPCCGPLACRPSTAQRALLTAAGAPLDRAGQVLTCPDCSVPGHPEIFVIGDMAAFTHHGGVPLPGVKHR